MGNFQLLLFQYEKFTTRMAIRPQMKYFNVIISAIYFFSRAFYPISGCSSRKLTIFEDIYCHHYLHLKYIITINHWNIKLQLYLEGIYTTFIKQIFVKGRNLTFYENYFINLNFLITFTSFQNFKIVNFLEYFGQFSKI